MKELWMDAMEEAITKYMADHPEATELEAVTYVEEHSDQIWAEYYGGLIDEARMRQD